MKPGRELDALVAEKVMGWKPMPGPAPTMDAGFKQRYWERVAKYTERLTPDYSFLPGLPMPVPCYSTDIAAAWGVVERMPMTVYAPGAPYAEDEYCNGGTWRAECQGGSAEGESAAHVICLAALKALGVEAV